MVEGNVRLKIIQGDSFDRQVYLEGVKVEEIEGIYFSCKELGICKKLPLIDNEFFSLNFTVEETKKFPKIETDYDLTIKIIGEKVRTEIYNSQLTVLPKKNVVTCLE